MRSAAGAGFERLHGLLVRMCRRDEVHGLVVNALFDHRLAVRALELPPYDGRVAGRREKVVSHWYCEETWRGDTFRGDVPRRRG